MVEYCYKIRNLMNTMNENMKIVSDSLKIDPALHKLVEQAQPVSLTASPILTFLVRQVSFKVPK